MDDLSHNVISRIRSCTVFYDEDDCTAHARFHLTEGEANKELDRIRAEARAEALEPVRIIRDCLIEIGLNNIDQEKILAELNAILADQAPEAEKVEGPQVKESGGANTLQDVIDLLEIARDTKSGISFDWVETGILLRACRAEVERWIQEGR